MFNDTIKSWERVPQPLGWNIKLFLVFIFFALVCALFSGPANSMTLNPCEVSKGPCVSSSQFYLTLTACDGLLKRYHLKGRSYATVSQEVSRPVRRYQNWCLYK